MKIDGEQLKKDIKMLIGLLDGTGRSMAPWWRIEESLQIGLTEIADGDLDGARDRLMSIGYRVRRQNYQIELPEEFQSAVLEAVDRHKGRALPKLWGPNARNIGG